MVIIVTVHSCSSILRGALRRYMSEIDSMVFFANCKKVIIDEIVNMIKEYIDNGKATIVYYEKQNSNPTIIIVNQKNIVIDKFNGIPIVWNKI